MIKEDDRTDEQKATHRWLVVARDRFMSGWGDAAGGYSWCAWACETYADALKVERWVRSRPEMRYVRVTRDTYRPGRNCSHWHVYVAGRDHRALAA